MLMSIQLDGSRLMRMILIGRRSVEEFIYSHWQHFRAGGPSARSDGGGRVRFTSGGQSDAPSPWTCLAERTSHKQSERWSSGLIEPEQSGLGAVLAVGLL